MHVIDRLAAVVAGVDHGAVSAGQAFGAGDFCRGPVEMSEKLVVLFLRVGNGGNVPARHYQYVHRRLRLDVHEGIALIILINRLRRDASINNLAEEAAHSCSESTG